jgi:hypothetical protein
MRSLALLWIALAIAGAGCGPREASPLVGAARDGNASEVRRLLASGADANGRWGVNDWTPLMHAVHKNQAGTARALIEGGALVDALGPHNETALMMAAGYGQEEMVRLLLKSGADASRREVHSVTALDMAVGGVVDIDAITVTRCQTGAVKALLEHSPTLTVNEKVWGGMSRTVKSLAGCEDVIRLVEERRKQLLERR